MKGLLSDLLEVYIGERYPVRRAGVLVQVLEHVYYRPGSDGEDEDEGGGSERMMSEVEALTTNPVSFVPVRFLSFGYSDCY